MENRPHITQDELETLERFWRQQFNAEEEKAELEERYMHDPVWREKADWVHLTIITLQETVVAGKLNDFHQHVGQHKPLRRISWLPWAAAAMAGVIAWVAVLLTSTSPERKLFAQYYKPDPGLPTLMGVSDHYEFENAMVDYKMGDYQKAIASWQKLLEENPGNDTLNYFIGSAYMADKQLSQALPYFERTIDLPQAAFLNDARWYKALILMQAGKKQEAMSLLEKTEHPDSEVLLRELNER